MIIAEESAIEGGDSSNVLITVLGAVVTIVVTVLGGFLKKKWSVDTEKAKLDSNKSLMEQRNFLIDNRVIPFAISTAEHWLLTQLMPIVRSATDDKEFDWGDHFDSLKDYVKDRVVKKFASENVDLIDQFGENELDNIIDRILVKLISNVPDSVKVFITDGVKDKLSDKASSYLLKEGKKMLGI